MRDAALRLPGGARGRAGGAEAVEKEAQKEEAKAGAKQGKNLSATVFNVKKVGIDTMVRGEHLSKGDRESRDSDSRGSRDSDGKKAAATVASDGKLEQAKEAADFFKHNKVLLRLLPPSRRCSASRSRTTATRGMNAKSKAANTIKLCAELINARAAEDPTLIILDNVQWLDPMGWKLLEKLHDDEKNEVCIMLCMRTDSACERDQARQLGADRRAAGAGAGGERDAAHRRPLRAARRSRG